jgi:predicted ribosome quality control (RQC) complex YloA/Tae2 family protein
MHYCFLKKWADENSRQHLVFQDIRRYEDQYQIRFLKQQKFLQVSLSTESFCFFTNKDVLPFRDDRTLNIFSQLKQSVLKKISIQQDRIINLFFEKKDPFDEIRQMQLVLELMPYNQNLILLQENKIIESVKKISMAENSGRQILPGLDYQPPETSLQDISDTVVYPLIVDDDGKFIQAKSGNLDNMNSAFEAYFYNHFLPQKQKRKKQSHTKNLLKLINKKKRKLENLETELNDADREEEWKMKGELLKANYAVIKKGMTSISVKNYFSEEFPEIIIELDNCKTPQQNIAQFFRKYRKARDGKIKIEQQILITQTEIEDLQHQIKNMENSDLPDETTSKSETARKERTERFRRLNIDENWQILIGRSSSENDLLITRIACLDDWWFHTLIFRGTHVILRNLRKQNLPEDLKILCARLAAYYSKAKNSGNVPVDYTQCRFLRKPRNAAPGFVVYSNQKTIYVDPLSLRAARESLTAK